LTDARPIKPTSTRCLSARRPNPGRGSTYRRGNPVQTTAATSFLGSRKIVTIAADEAAGVDGNVKELRRMKLSEGIDWFTGVISAGDTVALAPVAEELQIPTIFTDGCTDHLFDVVVKKPKYVFRVTNILSSDAVSCMVAASRTWPSARKRMAAQQAICRAISQTLE
jgi:hypothetical protein